MASLDYFDKFIKNNEEDYWLNNLAGELVKASFPYTNDTPPTNVNQHQRQILKFQLGGKPYWQLMKLSNNSEVRLHMILTAALVSLLNKYTGNQDIIVGTTIYKQETDAEFINTVLILRTRLSKNMTFKELLLQVKQRMTEVVENQNYPLERLLQKLEIPFSKSDHFPIFDVAIIVENIHDKRYLRNINPNMLFSFSNKEEYVEGTVEYNASLYEIEAIERVTLHLNNLLNEALDNVNMAIDKINILTPGEKTLLLYEVNNTKIKYPADKNLHELFEEQVEKTPGNIAVRNSCSSESITYRELNRKSNQLARLLRSKGIKTEEIAAVMIECSVELVIGIMGILKTGAGYLPIDPGIPVNRIGFMLEDSGVSILLTTKSFIPGDWASKRHYASRDIIFMDDENIYMGSGDNPENTTKPMNISYVIFTSGTSGTPKGVMVHHKGVVNYIDWAIKTYVQDEKLDFPLYTSISFDLTVTSIFIPLLTGSSIVIYSGEYKELLIGNIINDDSVGVVKITPSHLKLLRESEVPYPGAAQGGSRKRNIKHFIVGGEELNRELARTIHESFNGQIEIYNEYGPTETVVGSMIYKFNPTADQGKSVPIGSPVYNTQVYILDGSREPAPLTVTGEIYISGDGVARGYLNRPELTAEKFLENPFVPGERMYRTGDMGRWVEAGKMEFSGRIDHQLKIRGYRVEPGEIERLLLKKNEIKEAIAVVRDDDNGEKCLCVYIVSREKPELNKLREYLSGYLPVYMIPAYIMQIENIPLTPNGKVDRRAMPAPQPITGNKYAPPRNKVEKILTGIWEDILGIDNIGINDNFFTIGGDSIKTIQIVSRVKKAGYKIEMRDIFQESTIARLAPLLKKTGLIADQSVVSGLVHLTPIQHWFFQSQFPDNHHFNQAVLLYSQEGFEEEAIRAVFLKLQEHHDALRMTFRTYDGEIIQENHGLDYPFSLLVFDYRQREAATNALETMANRIQASIDLKTGPLMKLGLFHLEDGDRLLIAIHHLVIDGVSWRILFEDIGTLYQQYKKGKPLSLPLKTDSIKAWSAKLSGYANSESFLKEKAYWVELESLPTAELEKDLPGKDNDAGDTKTLSFSLSETETALFLTKVNEAFGTESNDILLTALGLSMKKTWGHHQCLAALEGHGREEIFEDMDISRTIGWFTTIYPVILDISYDNDLSRQIKEIKETLRHVPGKGIGYGVMKYLTAKTHKEYMEFKLKPQISFNYLGQFDADIKQISSFEIAKESPGITQSLRNKGEYEINISGIIVNNRLTMTISYNEAHFKPGTTAAFAGNFESELKHLIAFCASKENMEFSPSDFTYKGLSIEAVDWLMGRYPDTEDLYILTPMQEGMLFHALYDKDSPAYFEQFSLRIYGDLDVSMVQKSLNEISRRHEVLRTTFIYDEKRIDRPLQLVLQNRQVEFYYENICTRGSKNGVVERDTLLESFRRRDRERSFELSKDVLMRVAILQLDSTEYELIWSHHHILMDGWCTGILIREFFEIYHSYLEKRPYQLPSIKPYRNYIQWWEKQDKELPGRYWRQYLDGYDEPSFIPPITTRQEPGMRNNSGYKDQHVSFTLDRGKTRALNSLAARNNVTLNTLIQAGWGILLGKYCSKQDVVYGVVVSGRPPVIEGVETMVGLFINTIPIRIHWREKLGFSMLLRRLQQEAVESEPYHYYPLAEIQSASALKQNLLDHILVFENYPITDQIEDLLQSSEKKLSPLPLEISSVETFEQTNYNFNLIVQPGKQLNVQFSYNGYIYEMGLLERISAHFKHLLLQIIDNEQLDIESITLLSAEEKKRILYDFNNTDTQYPKDSTIHELFLEQAARTPGHTAIVYENTQLTYSELKQRTNQLAYFLKEKGAAPDTIAAIMIERSIEMIIGILGILIAGGAYLPIDTGYPRERIEFMLKDSNAQVLVMNDTSCASWLSSAPGALLNLSEEHHLNFPVSQAPGFPASLPSSLAYIIYTSGTTGKPKGTLLTHRNVVRLLFNDRFQFDFNSSDTWTLFHSYCFDFSVWEIYGALLYGGKLRLITRMTTMDTREFLEILSKDNITVLNQTPSAFYNLANLEVQTPHKHLYLKYVIFGGEVLKPLKLQQWKNKYPGTRLINMFGITETTVHVTYKEVKDREIRLNISNIGRPIPTLFTYIMGRGLQLLPPGVPGEICVSGEGVGRGYLNRPELTGEKFVNHPYISGQRLYKSGDLARFLENGDMEYLGRIDHQVKIRGFRIEPGEIENRLLQHEEINDAVVAERKKEDGEVDLYAYVVTHREFSAAELKEYLARELPAYMIPSYFIRIEKIPLTPNGKIDQKVLQSLDINLKTGSEYASPGNETEELIAAAWMEILHNDNLGIDDNFFDVGGHSLTLMRLNNKLNQVFQKNIPMVAMFRYPTVRSLALYIDNKKTNEFILDEKIDDSINIMEETTNFFFGDSDD